MGQEFAEVAASSVKVGSNVGYAGSIYRIFATYKEKVGLRSPLDGKLRLVDAADRVTCQVADLCEVRS